MTAIEQKRKQYILDKHQDDERYSDAKVEFLVRTGLTFDPQKLRSDKSEEEKHLDWYYPKGAGFGNSSNTQISDDETIQSIQDYLNTDEDGPDIINVNPDTNEQTEQHIDADDNIELNVVANENNEVLVDKDNNIIIIDN